MHEMSLAQSIVEIVENTAQQNQASSVVAVKLIIGELAGVEMHALMQGLKIASQGTVMQEAKIEIERPGGTAWCLKCQKTVPIHRRGEPCPVCGSYQLSVNGGDDFRVSELEIPSFYLRSELCVLHAVAAERKPRLKNSTKRRLMNILMPKTATFIVTATSIAIIMTPAIMNTAVPVLISTNNY